MRNPTRRNKNIGKTQGGRVRNGRASEKMSRAFGQGTWAKLSAQADGTPCAVFRENPSSGYYHPCHGEEYLGVLGQLPRNLRSAARAVVLRRISRHDARYGVEARRRFSCVILNAFPKTNEMVWKSDPGAIAIRHYGRWCANWSIRGNATVLRWSRDQVRSYYLYHLFLHELGHLHQPPFSKPSRREEFAENFALEWAERLGMLPPPFDATLFRRRTESSSSES